MDKINYFQNSEDKTNDEQIELIDTINTDKNNTIKNNGNSNLINLKTAHNINFIPFFYFLYLNHYHPHFLLL